MKMTNIEHTFFLPHERCCESMHLSVMSCVNFGSVISPPCPICSMKRLTKQIVRFCSALLYDLFSPKFDFTKEPMF